MPALLAEAPEGRSSATVDVADDAISVFIFAKDPISRVGVERNLLATPDITILTRGAARHPDVALVVADSIDDEVLLVIRRIRSTSLSRIVVVAAITAQSAEWAKAAGANAVVARAMADSRHLAWAIQKAHRGEGTVLLAGAEAPDRLTPAKGARAGETLSPFVSDRDREVLRLLAEGCDTGEIARTLAYSEPTIKNVIQRLFELLKAKNRPHVVALALRAGII
jgi:DNA-binding NarL/FixJ family response regulator